MALPPFPDVMGDTPRCVHCDDWTHFNDDPAPDLCARCRRDGKLSPMWGPQEEAAYLAAKARSEKGQGRDGEESVVRAGRGGGRSSVRGWLLGWWRRQQH